MAAVSTRAEKPRSWAGRLALIAYLIIAVAIGLEVLLRVFPSAIPLRLLRHFDDKLRISIAQRLGMPTRLMVREIARDDGGPPLFMSLPHVTYPLDERDPGGPVIIMDDRGFCNSPAAQNPPIDAITVGGSISWCVAVPPDGTWTARLGQLSGLRTYNMSVPGVGPYEYLQVVKQFGAALHPRFVFFDFAAGNDLRDILATDLYRAGHPSGQAEGAQQTVLSEQGGGFLARNSYLYALIRAALIRETGANNGERFKDEAGLPDRHKLDFRFHLKWDDRVIAMNVDNGDTDEPYHAMAVERGLVDLDRLRRPFEQLAELGKRFHFKPIVTYTPAAYTVYDDVAVFNDPAMAPLMRKFNEKQLAYVSALTAELGLTFVDLTPALRAAAAELKDRDLLYIPENLHLLAAGHRVIAQALAKRMADLTKQ
jgi:hypothetical protein